MYCALGFLLFDAVMTVLAVSPAVTFSDSASTALHVGVAAVNACVLSRWVGPFPGVYLTFTLCVLAEAVQAFSPTRSPSLGDIVADCIGIALGLAVFALTTASPSEQQRLSRQVA